MLKAGDFADMFNEKIELGAKDRVDPYKGQFLILARWSLGDGKPNVYGTISPTDFYVMMERKPQNLKSGAWFSDLCVEAFDALGLDEAAIVNAVAPEYKAAFDEDGVMFGYEAEDGRLTEQHST